MAKDLSKIAKQKKIKYFLISFVDLFGVLRSKLVPTEAIKEMQKNGAGKLRIPRDVELAGLDYNIMEQAQKDERAVASSNRQEKQLWLQ